MLFQLFPAILSEILTSGYFCVFLFNDTEQGFVDQHIKGLLLLFGEMIVHPIKKKKIQHSVNQHDVKNISVSKDEIMQP